MKKCLFIVMLLFLTGCSVKNINDVSIDEALNIGINSNVTLTNIYNKGYTYYAPKGFRLYSNDLYNQTLVSNGNKYYLNIDIISYHGKTTPYHELKEDSYYYKSFISDNKDGYLEIIQNNDYFFMEMMYNYAIIEVVVESNQINYATINMFNILNSIKYNDIVISNEIGENVLTHKEILYEIEKPKVEKEDKNFLDWIEEYDNYNEPANKVKDEDKITN